MLKHKKNRSDITSNIPDSPTQENHIDWKEKYLRALADYQNLEKRYEAEKMEVHTRISEQVFRELLPLVHLFETAQKHLNDQGLALAIKQLNSFLHIHGMQKMDVVEKPFDPVQMECIDIQDGKDGIVLKEVSPGYFFRGKIIQVAKVIVGKDHNQSFQNMNHEKSQKNCSSPS